jgi:hypothetical protein
MEVDMKTRRVRHAINKIGKELIKDGVEKDSPLWEAWIAFVDEFLKVYKKQWMPEKPKLVQKKPKLIFKADPKKIKGV